MELVSTYFIALANDISYLCMQMPITQAPAKNTPFKTGGINRSCSADVLQRSNHMLLYTKLTSYVMIKLRDSILRSRVIQALTLTK
jgi:hypothetical protein